MVSRAVITIHLHARVGALDRVEPVEAGPRAPSRVGDDRVDGRARELRTRPRAPPRRAEPRFHRAADAPSAGYEHPSSLEELPR